MITLYRIDLNGNPLSEIEPSPAKNEDLDLQSLLEKNWDLLPGDQIAGDKNEPLRWLLIHREMPVECPVTASDRWSLDFLFSDDQSVPTFVECKLFKNPEARRQVVGQMLEYVSNAQHYWTLDKLRPLVELNRYERFSRGNKSVDEFLENMLVNLKSGKVRMILFMDAAPTELKSIVMFLNEQLAQAEILIVEARQFIDDDRRYIVPTLFGYTEQARASKDQVAQQISGNTKWSRERFMAELSQSMSQSQRDAVINLIEYGHSEKFQVKWGRGKTGSMNVVAPKLCPRSIFTLWNNGDLTINLGWIGDELRSDLEHRLKAIGIPYRLGLDYPGIKLQDWTPSAPNFIDALDDFVKQI